MTLPGLFTLLALMSAWLVLAGRGRMIAQRAQGVALASAPIHYGVWSAIASIGASIAVILVWLIIEQAILNAQLLAQLSELLAGRAAQEIALIAAQIKDASSAFILDDPALAALRDQHEMARASSRLLMTCTAIALAILIGALTLARLDPAQKMRETIEKLATLVMFACASIAVFITIGVFLSLIFESIRFFNLVSPIDFLFGLEWNPQTALREGQIASEGQFGIVPLFTGTLLITLIALLVAGPVGLMSAIYMAEYASPKTHAIAKPVLEILAGIPTVVYGFFAALSLAPFIRSSAEAMGLSASSESALAAGIVMGIMIIPFISSLSDDVITAVPHNLRDGSYALGATKSETIIRVVLPAALPGIASGFLLAISRAIGETMIVVMAAGLAANLTANPLEAVTTVTVQIVTLLVGDQEFDSTKTLAAFALGLTLFLITFVLNTIALFTVRKYQEKYE